VPWPPYPGRTALYVLCHSKIHPVPRTITTLDKCSSRVSIPRPTALCRICAVSDASAARVSVVGDVADPKLRSSVRDRADGLGLRGWVRLMEDGTLAAHVEDSRSAADELIAWLRSLPEVQSVTERSIRVEGHEQFAIRGIPAGVFVVQEHQATAHHFDVRLEVDGVMRSWAVPKGPSMDPAVKRLAVEVDDHAVSHNDFEGRTGGGGVVIWDRGTYEQGGRVPWPQALERGHAVFVLHGEKLRGGFALQRTGRGAKPQWLLVKRRDEYARPGSDVAAERPESVASGVTLADLLDG
jgi:DNA ligase D-like protein (predicted 3'-phosphoesterase)